MESRAYHQHCGLARALDRVGERWTLLIVRDLLLGPRRYTQLLEGLLGITTNLLAKRLRSLEECGVIEKSGRGPATRYSLSEMGAALEPAVMELARWGGRFMPERVPEDRLDLGWALLSLKRRYLGGEHLRASIEIQGGRRFELVLDPDRLIVSEREVTAPDLRLRGETSDFFGLLFGGDTPGLTVEERREGVFAGFCRAFGLELTSPADATVREKNVR